MVDKEKQQIIDKNFKEDINDIGKEQYERVIKQVSSETANLLKLFYSMGFTKGVIHGVKIFAEMLK